MKKYLTLFTLLFLTAAIGVTTAICAIAQGHDDVTLTENVLIGDAASADGLIVTTMAGWYGRLHWNTVHAVGAEPMTECDYTQMRTNYSGTGYSSLYPLQMSTEPALGMDFTKVLDDNGLSMGEVTSRNFEMTLSDGRSFKEAVSDPSLGIAAAYNRLYVDAPIGEEVSDIVRLADYYDYYPINLTVQLPGVIWTHNDFKELSEYTPGTEADAVHKFREYFKIPVLADETLEIHLTRNANGGMSWGSSSVSGADMFSMNPFSAAGENACYFTFSTLTAQGNTVDTSEIAGGYGIYRIPFRAGTSTSDTGFDADSIEMVYPLTPGVEIEGMYLNTAGTHLLFVTKQDDRTARVEIIELSSMTCRQTFAVNIGDGYFSHIKVYEDYSVIVTNETLTVLSESGGVYTKEFTADIVDDGAERLYITSRIPTAFDGIRLAVVNPLRDAFGLELCGYYVSVYTAAGCVYHAVFESSLDTGGAEDGTWSSGYNTELHEIAVSFE